jgi:hypothetical protein
MSFLVGLLAMARLARRKWRHKSFVLNPIAAIAAAFSSPSSRIPGAGSRAASPGFAQPNTMSDRAPCSARSSAIRRAIAASDEILDCDRVRNRGLTLVTVS